MRRLNPRRIRSLALAALTFSGGAVPLLAVATAEPAAATVFAGLDCGIAGALTNTSYPFSYEFRGVGSAGPFATSGTSARLTCTVRRDSPTGAALYSWSVSDGSGLVPPAVRNIDVTYNTNDRIERGLYLCSTLTWQTLNGTQTASGCESATEVWFADTDPADGQTIEVWPVHKPQDADLDSTWP